MDCCGAIYGLLAVVFTQKPLYPFVTSSLGVAAPTFLLLRLTLAVSITFRRKTTIGFFFFLDFIIFRVDFSTLLTLEVVFPM